MYYLSPYYTIACFPDGSVQITSSSRRKNGEALAQRISKCGYKFVKIFNKSEAVHRVVARCAFGNPKPGMTVNHVNSNKLDNHPDNLEYATIAENIRHSIASGTHVCCTPWRMPTYKDGRCKDRQAYKKAWYRKNRPMILKRERARYIAKKGVAA